MKRKQSAESEVEVIYEYIGNTKTQILYSLCGITNPDPEYKITRPTKSNWYSIEYVVEGEGVVQEDDKISRVKGGDFFILHPGKYHHYYSDKKNPWKKIWVTFSMNTEFVTTLLKLYKIEDRTFFKGLNSYVHLDEIYELFQTERPDFNRELELLIYQMVIDLAYKADKLENSDTELDVAKRFIEKRVASKISVKDVADWIGVSYTYFSKTFKKKFGISPAKYIIEQKIELAKHLLANTNMSIPQISDHLAFSDLSYFSYVFSKTCGVSASEYRQQSKEPVQEEK